jgi:hypothetical protein
MITDVLKVSKNEFFKKNSGNIKGLQTLTNIFKG